MGVAGRWVYRSWGSTGQWGERSRELGEDRGRRRGTKRTGGGAGGVPHGLGQRGGEKLDRGVGKWAARFGLPGLGWGKGKEGAVWAARLGLGFLFSFSFPFLLLTKLKSI